MEPTLAIEHYRAQRHAGMERMQAMKSVREKFALTIMQAKEIMVKEEAGLNLVEYQKQLFEALEDELRADFELGEAVEVVGDLHTPQSGSIRDIVWHTELGEWHYYIESGGNKLPTRYTASDLKRISEQDATLNGG